MQGGSTFNFVDKILKCDNEMEAIELQYFSVVLLIISSKVTHIFELVVEIPMRDHSIESYKNPILFVSC